MWRAFFMAIGISLALIGLECMVIERAIFADGDQSHAAGTLAVTSPYSSDPSRSVEPPEWAPWSFLAAGAVVTLYSLFLKTGGGG